MSKFKHGDIVRALLGSPGDAFTKGRLYEVDGNRDTLVGYIGIRVNNRGHTASWGEEFFELVARDAKKDEHPNPYAPKVLEAFRALKEAVRTVDVLLELSPRATHYETPETEKITIKVPRFWHPNEMRDENGVSAPKTNYVKEPLAESSGAVSFYERPGKLPHKPWPHTPATPTYPDAWDAARVSRMAQEKKYTDGAYHWLRVPVTSTTSAWIVGKYYENQKGWRLCGHGLVTDDEIVSVGPRIHMPPEDDWNE
jgi:hypothetical protein